jgi:hypothetical protein
MTLKNDLTAEEVEKLAQESIGVVELSDEMLQMVAGGSIGYSFRATCPNDVVLH